MRVLWEMFEDEISWTLNYDYDDTIEEVDSYNRNDGYTIKVMCADVPTPDYIRLENLVSHNIWEPIAWSYENDNTVMITEFEITRDAEDDDED